MSQPGGADVLTPAVVDLPWPGSSGGEVLVRLRAAAVNPADLFFRSLGPYVGDGKGCVLGHDGAGIVEAVGENVKTVKPGDRVCFCHGGIGADHGTYSRHAVVPEEVLATLPDGVDFVDAAALSLVFITVWEALVERAAVKPGEHVLVHAGAGGTGHIAVQVARICGGRVATTVSSPDKARFTTDLGADRPVLYRDEDFVTATRAWSRDEGVAVALDNVGSEVMRRTFLTMKHYGRIVTLMGTPGDTEGEDAYLRNLSIHNVMMLTPMWKGMKQRLREQAQMLRTGLDWLAEGKLAVHVQETFPLDKVADAHRLLEAGGTTGKIALAIE